MINTKKIKKILHSIGESLYDLNWHNEDYGLLSGYFGSALFYAYYYKLTDQKKYLHRMNCIIEKTMNALAEKKLLLSHCSGVSGIAWAIQHLIKMDLIEQHTTENIFEEADKILADYMLHELSKRRYDFLHEGLGVMLYFLDKLPDAKAELYLKDAIAKLETAVVTTTSGKTWRDYSTSRRIRKCSATYNLGLSHGVPAILSILSVLHEKKIAPNKTLILVENGVQWLLSTKNNADDKFVSLYPTAVAEDNQLHEMKNSRLGWCYGDLSVAVALHNIGTRLKNDTYKQEAFSIFDYTLEHRSKENGSILDTSLCHGSMGVSHIYRRAYLATADPIYLNGANQWLRQTLNMADNENKPIGFRYHTPNGYENNYSLLEGLTGIGLALIAVLDTHMIPDWDRCLLLS
jgi:lantibiotic modifying enzyme